MDPRQGQGESLDVSSAMLDDNTEMTSSYHEIVDDTAEAEGGIRGGDFDPGSIPVEAKRLLNKARNWVGDLSLEGMISQEGQQLTYVTQDLTERIRNSPPPSKAYSGRKDNVSLSSASDSMYSQASPSASDRVGQTLQHSDLNSVVNEMEIEAKKLAQSVDTLTENLTGILHSLSSMTVDCVFTATDGVTQLCDTADASIKVMYQVMAKCEELNKAVLPLYQVHQQIKETKRLLDKVEAEMY